MRVTEYGIELVKEKATNYKTDNKVMDSPKKIVELMREIFNMDIKAEEYLYMLSLDNNNNLIGVFEISHGTVNATLATPREVFMRALLSGAVSIILVHNHPSGNLKRSTEDYKLTKRIYDAGKIMGIQLLDHIIIAGENYVSMLEENELDI